MKYLVKCAASREEENMKITYLGTAAYEGVPALFCECIVCQAAREALGRNVRCRASTVIDDDLLIDLAPDVNYSSVKAGVLLSKIRNVLFTHSHSDHFAYEDLRARDRRGYCTPGTPLPLHVYGNRRVGELFCEHCADIPDLVFHEIAPFDPVQVGAYRVTALPADHKPDEDAYIYLIEKAGKRLLYAHDTGMLPEETLSYLKGHRLDLVSFDCTHAVVDIVHNHMGLSTNILLRDRLRDLGCIDEKTVLVCSHFSHNGLHKDGVVYLHDDFSKLAEQEGFITAYDSLSLSV